MLHKVLTRPNRPVQSETAFRVNASRARDVVLTLDRMDELDRPADLAEPVLILSVATGLERPVERPTLNLELVAHPNGEGRDDA